MCKRVPLVGKIGTCNLYITLPDWIFLVESLLKMQDLLHNVSTNDLAVRHIFLNVVKLFKAESLRD